MPFIALSNNKKLSAYFNYNTFYSPQSGPYVETYLSIIGNSLQSKAANGKKQGEVEVTLLFKQQDKIIDFKKYSLKSPEVADSIKLLPNFIDVQRFTLANGAYDLELQIADKNSADSAFTHTEKVTVGYNPGKVSVSSIQLVESHQPTVNQNILSKSGYDLVPYIANYYPESMNKLVFYAEIYNTLKQLGAEEKFLVNYFIESYETNVKFSNYNTFSRKTANDVTIVFGEFPIEKLPSGNYNLVVEARNKNNELLAQRKLFFQRNNKAVELDIKDLATIDIASTFVAGIGEDTLTEYIQSMRPISTPSEQNYASNNLKAADKKLKQQYFYNFWKTRNPADPNQAWQNYYEEVQKVNEAYSTSIRKGYETDRGYTYLKYGSPNTISPKYNEPSAYPYEVWHYYKIGNYSNKRFIFYNPDLVTNDFELLHSDLFGEINNPRWQTVLHKRDTPVYDLYEDKASPHFGGESDDIFQNPR